MEESRTPVIDRERVSIEELLEAALDMINDTTDPDLRAAGDDVSEALVKVRLWVIGQGIL